MRDPELRSPADAALEAKEPKPCEGFVCCKVQHLHVPHPYCASGKECNCTCGQPYSAHQQPAQAGSPAVPCVPAAHGDEGTPPRPQPARTAVPPMPFRANAVVWPRNEPVCGANDVRIVHAAAHAIAAERDAALERAEAAEVESLEQARLLGIGGSREAKLLAELQQARAELAAMKEQNEAALAEVRRDERERCDRTITEIAVRVDTATQHLDALSIGGIKATARVKALYEAREAIRALRDGGEG